MVVGQRVGKYRVVSRLGRGGMGTVYKAVDETLDREVALKCLNADLRDPDLLKRFRGEAITLARLNHPNIATLFELTEHDGALVMVMEFVRGQTLDLVASQAGPMAVDRAVHLCAQVLDALVHAHRAGIVHRDLKPANLMFTETGLVKVMDFGLARMAGTEHLTNDGYMVGTPAYMAPEQVLGLEIDGRTDLYAMGVVLFRLLTGQLPFKAESGIAMAQKQISDPPTPVRQLRTELSAGMEATLQRALAKAPAERYQTAEDFRAALAVLTGVPSEITERKPALAGAPASAATLRAGEAPSTMPRPRPSSASETERTLLLSATPLAGPRPAPNVHAGWSRRRVVTVVAASALLLAGIPAVLLWRGRTPAPQLASTPAASTVPSADVPMPSGIPGASPGVKTAPAFTGRVLPLVTFARIKLQVVEQGKRRDREASLRFEPAGMLVVDGATTLERAAYREIVGVFHAHAREPRWAAADGTAISIGKASAKFAFLRGVPDWITIRTRKALIPLRVQDEALGRVIAELEARTGAKVIRTR